MASSESQASSGPLRPRRLSRAAEEERRLAGGRLLADGTLSAAEIARQLGVGPKTVAEWARRLRDHGPEGLKSRSSARLPRHVAEKRRILAAWPILEGKLTYTSIARQIGVTGKTVAQWAKQLHEHGLNGLRTRNPAGLSRKAKEERRLAAGRLLMEGKLSPPEVAHQMGVTRKTVMQWTNQLQEHGLDGLRTRCPTMPPRRTRQERWQAAKLVEEGQWSLSEASRQMGVTRRTIIEWLRHLGRRDLPDFRLHRRPKLTGRQEEIRRLAAAQLLLDGELTQAEIARHVGASRRAVHQWAARLQKGSLDALKMGRYAARPLAADNPDGPRPRRGYPPRLSQEDWRRVVAALNKGARSAGFSSDRWTLRRIQEFMLRQFHVTYHVSYLSTKLKGLGWSTRKAAALLRQPPQPYETPPPSPRDVAQYASRPAS